MMSVMGGEMGVAAPMLAQDLPFCSQCPLSVLAHPSASRNDLVPTPGSVILQAIRLKVSTN